MTQIIDQLPLPVPSRTDPTNFSVRADNFLGELPDFATQVNALATELTALGNTVETNKNTAVTAANNAQASAFAATGSANNAASSSGAALWVSGTTYSAGYLVYSPITGRTYRRKIAGAGTTDPSADATNWIPIVLEISTQYPTIRPSLNLDFVNNKYLDPRITFTRSSTAKYFDGKTVHKAEENLLIRSEEFDNAAWVKDNTTVTVNTQVNPFGQSTSETLTEIANNAPHVVYQTLVGIVAGSTYTFSVYVKYNTLQYVQLAFDSAQGFSVNAYANFDVQNGTAGVAGSGTTSNITPIGSGWYRIAITCPAISSSSSGSVYLLTANSSSMSYYGSYTGSTSNSVYIFGAQVEQRSSVGPYQATTTQPVTNYQSTLVTASVNQPRFDHDPVTKECKGLLIEDATTNLLTYSEDFGNAAWSKPSAGIQGDIGVAPDGTISADSLRPVTTGEIYRVFSYTTSITYTLSVYAKANGKNWLSVGTNAAVPRCAFFDLNTGAIGAVASGYSAVINGIGNGWYRCSVTFVGGTNTDNFVDISVVDTNNSPSSTAAGYSGVYIWGAQLEDASASPSSYVATAGATASRSYDNAVMTGTNFLSWYNQEEGSVYAEVKLQQKPLSGSFNNYLLNIKDSSGNNRLTLDANVDSKLRSTLAYNNVNQTTLEGLTSYNMDTIYKVSVGLQVDNVASTFNTERLTDTSAQLPKNMDTLVLGRATVDSTGALRGHLRRFTYYPKKLTNQELQTLTAI